MTDTNLTPLALLDLFRANAKDISFCMALIDGMHDLSEITSDSMIELVDILNELSNIHLSISKRLVEIGSKEIGYLQSCYETLKLADTFDYIKTVEKLTEKFTDTLHDALTTS
jgi:hypothetical protein